MCIYDLGEFVQYKLPSSSSSSSCYYYYYYYIIIITVYCYMQVTLNSVSAWLTHANGNCSKWPSNSEFQSTLLFTELTEKTSEWIRNLIINLLCARVSERVLQRCAVDCRDLWKLQEKPPGGRRSDPQYPSWLGGRLAATSPRTILPGLGIALPPRMANPQLFSDNSKQWILGRALFSCAGRVTRVVRWRNVLH